MSVSADKLGNEFEENSVDVVLDKYDGEVLKEYDRDIKGYTCKLRLFKVDDLFVFFENNPKTRRVEVYNNESDPEDDYMSRRDIYESRKPRVIFG